MAKEQVAFPADIREDAAFLGVRMGDVLKIILPAIVVGIGFAMLPLPVLLRLFFFIGIPAGAIVWIAADIPGQIRRRKRYRTEPAEYSFSPSAKQKGMANLVTVKDFYGPFIEFADQSLAVVLRLDSTPWITMGDGEADAVAFQGFRMVLRDAYMAGAEILITQDAGRQLLRYEWDRQEQEYTKRFTESPALSFALDRVNHHRNLEMSRGEECHLRIRLSPREVEFARKPDSPEEQREILAEMLTDLIESIMKDLAPYYIASAVLGAEAVRDLATRQLNPIEYQRQAYQTDVPWRSSEIQEIEKSEKVAIEKEHRLKGLANRLQAYSKTGIHLKEELSKLSKDTISSVFEKGKGGITSAILKYQSKVTEKTEVLPDMEESQANTFFMKKVITIWNPTRHMKTVTALNLAVAAVQEGKDVALLNYDLHCPDLDSWFGIKQTPIAQGTEKDAGILTFGESLCKELSARLLREIKWGVRYLPAGNKLGNIGTPDFGDQVQELQLFKDIIKLARERGTGDNITIINAGCSFEYTATYAALTEADILVIPTTGTPQEGEVIRNQLHELSRVGVIKPVIELLFRNEDADQEQIIQISPLQHEIETNTRGYLKAANQGEPYYFRQKGYWNSLVQKILTPK